MKRLLLATLVLCSTLMPAQTPKLTAMDVLSKSLSAIGSPELLKSVNYYELTGNATLRTTAAGGTARGTALLVSEGNMVKFVTKFPSGSGESYGGDQLVFDGKSVKVSDIRPGVHSKFGALILWQQDILKRGLLGGVLCHGWPVYDLNAHAADFTYEGKSKVDGREVHRIGYRPKKLNSSLTVYLFFDAENYRHLKTTYKIEGVAPSSSNAVRTAGSGAYTPNTIDETQTNEIDETFSDFRAVGGLTIPTQHKLTYAIDGNTTVNWFWEMNYTDLNGVGVSPQAK